MQKLQKMRLEVSGFGSGQFSKQMNFEVIGFGSEHISRSGLRSEHFEAKGF